MDKDLAELLERFGTLIVFLNALLHEIGVPAPLTPTVLLAGAAMSDALPQTAQLALAIVAGTVLGNSVWFALGRKYGSRVLGWLCRLSLSPESCITKTGSAFGRWGGALLVVGRFVPGVSLVAPPIAGALGMGWPRFLVLSAMGAALWALPLIVLGYVLKDAVLGVLRMLEEAGMTVVLLAAATLAIYVAWRYVRRRRARRMDGIPRIAPEALLAALDAERPPVVIDVRATSADQVGGPIIPTALFHTLDGLRRMPVEALLDRSVVLYCACPREASAAMGALILQGRGHVRVHALQGGLDAWIARGHPVVESAAVRAREPASMATSR